MDRYVIRVPTPSSSSSSPNKKGSSRLKQATIESLKGVVVVDDILRHKARLKLETVSKEEKLNSLQELEKKIPPRHVMLSTKIGNLINKLRNHEDEDIKRAARKVYVKWKTHFVEHMERPILEVKCDLKTEKLRNTGKELLAGALAVEKTHKLPDAIEREVFHAQKRLIANSYKRTMRHLVFTLKNQQDIKEKVLSGEITVTDFVKQNKKL